MRAAAIAGAIVAVFIGVMYLRFSGDAVPEPEPKASPIVRAYGSVCIVTRRVGAPHPTPTPTSEAYRAPCDDEYYPVPTPIPTLVPTVEQSGHAPGILQGRRVSPFEYGSEVDVPDGVALIIETGCTQCDGPATGLSRVYRNGQGVTVVEQLFTPAKVGLLPQLVQTSKGPREEPPVITGLAVATDGSDMAVSVCSATVYCGGGPGHVGVHKAFRSIDGGVTWSDLGTFEPGEYLVAALAQGFLVGTYPVGATVRTRNSYRTFPDGTPIDPPSQAGPLASPIISSTDEIFWETEDGSIVRQEGTPSLENTRPEARIQPALLTDPDGVRHLIAFSDASNQHYLSLLDPNGELGFTMTTPGFIHLGVMISRREVFVNAGVTELIRTPLPSPFVGSLPLVLDLETGGYHPIAGPFLEPPLLNGRNTIRAVQQGPFARVVNTEGTCLYIRADATASAAALDCAAEGVLLRTLGPERLADGVFWLSVATPAGIEGWASAQYLER